MKIHIVLAFLLQFVPSILMSQPVGLGGGLPWVLLDSTYRSSPLSDTTFVDIYFDGMDYVGSVEAIQFELSYDGSAFDGIYGIDTYLHPDFLISYNNDQLMNTITVGVVNMGPSPIGIPTGPILRLNMVNIHPSLVYYNSPNLMPFNFTAFPAMGSNSDGLDVPIGLYNYGGVVHIPVRVYSGYVRDINTGLGIPYMQYQLVKTAGPDFVGPIQPSIWDFPPFTAMDGRYEMVYYEDYYGDYVEGQTTFSFEFFNDIIDSDMALSSADAYTQLLYSTRQLDYSSSQRFISDVNHSHTSTIADAYTLFAYLSSRFLGWEVFGHGGYGDVMFIHPNDVRYFNADSLSAAMYGIGSLGIEPIKTDFVYNLAEFNGQSDFEEDFYVGVMGDVNGTSLSGQPFMPKLSLTTSVVDTVFVKVPSVIGSVGSTITVPVMMKSEQPVSSFNFRLEYDPTSVQLIETSTNVLTNSWMVYFNTDVEGVVDYGGMDGSAGKFPMRVKEYEPIVTFKFRALESVSNTPLTFGVKNSVGDLNGRDMVTQVDGGSISANISTSNGWGEGFPDKTTLGDAYPNPFNPTTIIPIYITNTENVKLEVYDVNGRLVNTLYNGVLSVGEYMFSFDGNGLSSGLYIYRLTSSDNVVTKKMVLIK